MLSSDAPPSPGLNMEHGFVRKIEENQISRHYQMKEEALRRRETAKLARRVGMPNKSTKPTIEIYRPPGVRVNSEGPCPSSGGHPVAHGGGSEGLASRCRDSPPGPREDDSVADGNPRAVHFQVPPVAMAIPVTAVGSKEPSHLGGTTGKSALRRSKSFSHDEAGTERGPPWTPGCQELLKKALDDPNALRPQQLMELVRAICTRATEGVQYAEPSARLCLTIVEKERGDTFAASLVHACREWFNERDVLLRGEPPTSPTSSAPRRWTAYVTFLAELYLGLRRRSPPLHSSGEPRRPHPASRTQTLVMLLYDCCQIILRPPSLYNAAEMECLRSVLTVCGKPLEQDSGQRMETLTAAVRDAFLLPTVAAQARKTLLELVELRAGAWQFTLPQRAYHFPYTSIERK